MTEPLKGYFLGRRAYAPTFELMTRLFDARRAGMVGDTVLLLEHEPVITLGRGAHSENLLASEAQLKRLGVALAKTGRGGDVTLHAPGQLIAYPIINLAPDRQDVRKYVQSLTEVMRRVVRPSGIAAGTIDGMIGLWTDAQSLSEYPGQENLKAPTKIGAIGVRISRWVTLHGFALNLTTDLRLFQLIVPCGISEYPVASVESLTGKRPDLKAAAERALLELNELLGEGEAVWADCEDESDEAIFAMATEDSATKTTC